MITNSKPSVVVVGGGLAGLIAAIRLVRRQWQVTLIEKKKYPFHRVCGEYISQEVKPFLLREGLLPTTIDLPTVNQLEVTAASGAKLSSPLAMGGFGISRYTFDNFLYELALQEGVNCIIGTQVVATEHRQDKFIVETSSHQTIVADLVIGAFGKRSLLDKKLDRDFQDKPAPYIGLKYHALLDWDSTKIALHNFPDGYCGVSRIENNRVNICYLTTKQNLKKSDGDIAEMETRILHQNPYLKEIWQEAHFIWEQPLVINEITFAPRRAVEKGVLMIGDAAGLITPLCGNGMAIAIRTAVMLTDILLKIYQSHRDLPAITAHYTQAWQREFAFRLWIGRNLQKLFGGNTTTHLAVSTLGKMPFMLRKLIATTHGKVI